MHRLLLLAVTFAIGFTLASRSVFLPPPSASAETHNFTSNLTLGSRGADVTLLQEFLVSKGHLQMPAGVAYGYFGPLTRGAVAQWQAANGITPAARQYELERQYSRLGFQFRLQ